MLSRKGKRRTGTLASGSTTLAYLKEAGSPVLCFYAPCAHKSSVVLCDFRDIEVASYCSGHGRRALREYGAALARHAGEDNTAVA